MIMKTFNKFKKRNLAILLAKSLYAGEGGDGGDGGEGGNGGDGGNTGGVDVNSQEFKDAVSAAAQGLFEKEADGLKRKNSELLDKLSKANEMNKQFEGLDIEKLKQVSSIIEKDEEMKLIAEGKIDEVLQKKTDALKAEYNDQISQLTSQLEKSSKNESMYKTQLDQNRIREELTKAAVKSKVRADAVEDIVRRGFETFNINPENGEIESRDAQGNLRQTEDNLILNPERFVESLKETNPYYWGASTSGGTGGSGDQTGGQYAESQVAVAAQGTNGQIDMATYRKNREKMSGKNYHQR